VCRELFAAPGDFAAAVPKAVCFVRARRLYRLSRDRRKFHGKLGSYGNATVAAPTVLRSGWLFKAPGCATLKLQFTVLECVVF
jgi:hypothetical protein